MDRFAVTRRDDGGVDVAFRLTSLVRREDGDVEVALRAGMRFAYRVTADGRAEITEYEARPKLSTVTKTV